jgi:hypothetical protein
VDEREWLASVDPQKMLRWLYRPHKRNTNRKDRLFGCACLRSVWGHLSDERSR